MINCKKLTVVVVALLATRPSSNAFTMEEMIFGMVNQLEKEMSMMNQGFMSNAFSGQDIGGMFGENGQQMMKADMHQKPVEEDPTQEILRVKYGDRQQQYQQGYGGRQQQQAYNEEPQNVQAYYQEPQQVSNVQTHQYKVNTANGPQNVNVKHYNINQQGAAPIKVQQYQAGEGMQKVAGERWHSDQGPVKMVAERQAGQNGPMQFQQQKFAKVGNDGSQMSGFSMTMTSSSSGGIGNGFFGGGGDSPSHYGNQDPSMPEIQRVAHDFGDYENMSLLGLAGRALKENMKHKISSIFKKNQNPQHFQMMDNSLLWQNEMMPGYEQRSQAPQKISFKEKVKSIFKTKEQKYNDELAKAYKMNSNGEWVKYFEDDDKEVHVGFQKLSGEEGRL